jgi:hypothetical protein
MTDLSRPDPDPALDTTVTPSSTAPADAGHEAAAPISTSPVGGAPGEAQTARRRGRGRWFAALGIVALVVAGTAAATLMLTGTSPAATVMGYVPTDSVVYGEVRLDLPGDQERKIGEFLSKFPGFADQAALDTKLDEVLDRLISDASDGEQTFTADIKPWFDGEMGFAVGPLPDAAALTDPESAAADGRALVLLSIKDEALARAWFDEVMAESGTTGTTETYEGVQLTVFTEVEVTSAQAAFAIIDGKVAVAGDLASVKAAVDTGGDAGLSDDPAFAAATAAMDGDHVGFIYIDTQALVERALDLASGMESAPPVTDAMLALVPDWMAGRLRIESDALVIDGAFPHVDGAPGPDTIRANGVADWAPAGTIMLAAGNDAGATVLETLELYRSDPNLAELFEGIDGATGILGGPEAAVGWIGDAGLVLAQDGEDVEGGVIALPTDPDAARQLMTTVRSFATLGGGGQGITVREEPYAGTTITIIDLGSAQDLVGMAGALGGATLPTEPGAASLPEGNVELSYAVTDAVVVIGSGPDFVKSVLDAGSGSSLADDARYQDLVARVGEEHTGVTFMDIAAFRGILEGFLDEATAEDRAEYEESVKPFLVPFDAFIAASTVGGDLDTQHAVITVK